MDRQDNGQMKKVHTDNQLSAKHRHKTKD
jgi:hypothetical protein